MRPELTFTPMHQMIKNTDKFVTLELHLYGSALRLSWYILITIKLRKHIFGWRKKIVIAANEIDANVDIILICQSEELEIERMNQWT